MNIKTIFRAVNMFVNKHSPEILIGSSVIGFAATTIMTAKTAPYLRDSLERLKREKENPTIKDKVKATAKMAAPIVVMFGLSTTAAIFGCTISNKRNAILGTTLAATELTLNQYQAKTIELLGQKAHESVKEAIIEEKATAIDNKSAPVVMRVVEHPEGSMRCYEASTERTFWGTIESIRKVQNDINEEIFQGFTGFVTLNDFYYRIGLDETSLGNDQWWDVNHTCNIDVTPIIRNDEYCLYVEPKNYTR